jgi:hypothetical protein
MLLRRDRLGSNPINTDPTIVVSGSQKPVIFINIQIYIIKIDKITHGMVNSRSADERSGCGQRASADVEGVAR